MGGASGKRGRGSRRRSQRVPPDEPLVFVVSGPSGAGKTTLVNRLAEADDRLRVSVSATTRPMRPGEKEGVDYRFITEAEFARMVSSGEFLEHAEVFGRRYGTPRRELDLARAEGRDLLLEIDVQGAAQVRRQVPGSVSIFVVPESPEELERRLRGRRTETEEAIRRRLDIAKAEVAEMPKYDYLVTNDEVDAAAERLRAIIAAERCRPGRTGAFRAWKRMTSTS